MFPHNEIDYRVNNLNLIRLLAAFQVLIGHLHEEFPVSPLHYLTMFNGVPIFFTISGFLIYWSYDNNPTTKQYFVNRFLRIYPALVVALAFTIVLMFIFDVINVSVFSNTSFYLWICAQLSFIQEFTPEILKGLGHGGTPNPPLWTISVEMLLYMFIPILYKTLMRFSKRMKTILLLSIALLSYFQNQNGYMTEILSSISSNGYWLILIHPFCQFFSFVWYFVVGILIYLYKDTIIPCIYGKGLIFLIVYVIICVIGFLSNVAVGSYTPHGYSLLLYFHLILTVFSLAYTKPTLTKKLFGRMDISYGLYIYHMLVLKTFYELKLTSTVWMLSAMLLCFLVAFFSWELVEKKALKLKTKSLYKGA